MKNIALIELGNSHDECLYSQVLFLKAGGYNVHLVCSEILTKQVSGFDKVDSFYFVDAGKGGPGEVPRLAGIIKYLKGNGIDKAIINTASGNAVRNLLLLPSPGIEWSGIIHNTARLAGSFNQSLISRKIRKYFVLNDFLLENVPSKMKPGAGCFYPIFFPEFRRTTVEKNENDFLITIPGRVEFKRRDYMSLIQNLIEMKPTQGVKFLLLGNSAHSHGDGGELRQMLSEAGLQEHFILFDHFIDNDLFFSYIEASDMILPLIHPEKAEYANYAGSQISGTYNLAFGYKIPLLASKYFEKYDDFIESSFFYGGNGLTTVINELSANRELIGKKKKNMESYPKFSFEEQCSRYLKLLDL